MRNASGIRTSSERWSQLFMLMMSFEHAIEASSRLDAYDDKQDARGHASRKVTLVKQRKAARFNTRLVAIEHHIDAEFDRLTSDKLRLELAEKIAVVA